MQTPQLDHYVGRTIQRVLGDSESDDFTIVLDGNKRIHVEGTPPSGLEKGLEFMEVRVDGENRELRFCRMRKGEIEHEQSVMTEQGSYTISDEDHPSRRTDPSVVDDEIQAARPPDPSPDRDKGESTRGD